MWFASHARISPRITASDGCKYGTAPGALATADTLFIVYGGCIEFDLGDGFNRTERDGWTGVVLGA